MTQQKGFANNAILMQHRNLRDKVLAFEQYGGEVCACCGETDLCFLSLDHVEGSGNNERREFFRSKFTAGHHMFRELKLRGYPPGYQVLCMNCNIGRYRNGGICPHKQKCLSGRERLEDFDKLRVGWDGPKPTRKQVLNPKPSKPRRRPPLSPSDLSNGAPVRILAGEHPSD